MDLDSGATLDEVMARIGAQEAVRHERLTDMIESTVTRGIYEVVDEFDSPPTTRSRAVDRQAIS